MLGNKVIYEVKGIGSVTFGDTRPYFCESFEASSISSNCQTNTAIGVDGQTASDITLQSKVVQCKFALLSLTKNQKAYDYEGLERMKEEIIKIFNPKNTGVLTRINSRGVFQNEARPSETPIFENIVGASCRFSMNFVLDNPIWCGTREKVCTFDGPGDKSFFNNFGMDIPFILKGTVPAQSTFSIENLTNGKSIVLRSFKDYDMKFELDTASCRVLAQTSEGGDMQRANYIFTASSDLDMILESGENQLRYSVEGDYYTEDDKAISIVVYDRYVGVV